MSNPQFRIEQAPSPNYTKGRRGKKIIAITDHITAGLYPGCLTWMQNPNAYASANYLVTRTGKILQLVNDADTAWASGIVSFPNWPLYDGSNPNYYTLSIEHEGYKDQGGDGNLTEIQYQASLWLHKLLIERHGLPVNRNTIIGHYRIDSVNRPNCPGPRFPWNRLFKDLEEVQEMVYKTLDEVPSWGKPLVQKLIDRKSIAGDGKGNINLPESTLKTLVILEREGVIK